MPGGIVSVISHYVTSRHKPQRSALVLDLFNKVKGVDSRITPDTAKDRW